ncbi:MAG: capsular polysaccharide export protein, LipB/KpsS family [Brevundimonas sp.]|jgi:hypothetical protein|uniref:capsular polysaccharide export protein, LipB/KpsS family n=1 Tax=Brevundimonas sp. TaxID=1871086 RepID=UPI0040349F18
MTKPAVLLFARGYQADFYPALKSDAFESVLVTLTPDESARVARAGGAVAACFESDYPTIEPADVPDDYLISSYVSERFLGRFGFEKRREILGKEIAFWADLLDRHQPVAVVNELVALEISEVLLIECRKRGIPYLAGMNCVVDNLFYWIPDPMTLSGHNLSRSIKAGAESRAAAKAYITEVFAKDYRPFYVKNLASRFAPVPLAKAVVKWVLWQARKLQGDSSRHFVYEMYDEEYGKRISIFFKSLFRKYDQLDALPKGAEVVFYPLHQEPEATLNYMSEYSANQVASIENILKCLNTNQVLAVKEHPVDKGSLLRQKFWDLKKRNSALYFFPGELHGREVLAKAERVVTMTSTVGWEAAVTGKIVYVMGEIFYNHLSGLQEIKSWPELKAALRRPASEAPRMSVEEATAFVAELAEISYRGNPFPHADLYKPGNVDDVVAAIVDGAGLRKNSLRKVS